MNWVFTVFIKVRVFWCSVVVFTRPAKEAIFVFFILTYTCQRLSCGEPKVKLIASSKLMTLRSVDLWCKARNRDPEQNPSSEFSTVLIFEDAAWEKQHISAESCYSNGPSGSLHGQLRLGLQRSEWQVAGYTFHSNSGSCYAASAFCDCYGWCHRYVLQQPNPVCT